MNKKHTKRYVPFATLAGLALLTSQAQAVVNLSIEPSTESFHSGETLVVDIAASGLDNADLGGFDLALNFDPGVLGFQSYTLGTELFDPSNPPQIDFSDTTGVAAGILRLGEVSGLFDFSGQPDAFVLASASFAPLSRGTSPLTLSDIDLSDDLAGSLQVGAVGNARVSVPVPGGLLLLPIGLGLLGVQRLRRHRGHRPT
jgi:hypothetical protein